MFAIEQVLAPGIDEVILHPSPFDNHSRATSFNNIRWSYIYYCPKCGKMWAHRTVIKEDGAEEFIAWKIYCEKCGGDGRLFDDQDLHSYLPRLPKTLLMHEFVKLYEEIIRERRS